MTTRDRPQAVLFDLFNTLVPGGSRTQRDEVARRMAAVLDVEADLLAELIRRTFDERTRGRLGNLADEIRCLARQLGSEPDDDAIDEAVQLRLAMTRRLLEDTWALGALAALRDGGSLLGLVSDCSAETPMIWPETRLSTYFDAVSFSCVTGHRKPEPLAYLTAVRQLRLRPDECLFVGDGGSHELTGAADLGMQVCRFLPDHTELGDPIDADTEWTGATVTDLHDVIALSRS